jgi:hypothetical protein
VSSSYIDGTATAYAIWRSNTTDLADYAVLQDNGQLCIYLRPVPITTPPVTCFGAAVGSDIGNTDIGNTGNTDTSIGPDTTTSTSSTSHKYDAVPAIAGSISAAVVLLAMFALAWFKRKGALHNSCKRSNSSRLHADNNNCGGILRSAPFSTVRSSSSSRNNRKVAQRPRILTFAPSVAVESPVNDAEIGTTATAHDDSVNGSNNSNSSSRNSSSIDDSIATAAAAANGGINSNNTSQLQRSSSNTSNSSTGYYVNMPSKRLQPQQQATSTAAGTAVASSDDRSLQSTTANDHVPEHVLVHRHMMQLCEDITNMFSTDTTNTNSNCGEIVSWAQRLRVSTTSFTYYNLCDVIRTIHILCQCM